MTLKRWFGFRGSGPLLTASSGQLIANLGLDFTNISDGDTILRWLVAWRLETVLLDNSSGLEKAMIPYFVSVGFSPTPDGEPEGSAETAGGDQVYRDFARWRPQNWTDGSTFATKWYADSPGGMQSVQGQREILDKTTAQIQVTISNDEGGIGLTGTDFIWPDIKPWWWLDILVLHK